VIFQRLPRHEQRALSGKRRFEEECGGKGHVATQYVSADSSNFTSTDPHLDSNLKLYINIPRLELVFTINVDQQLR
jgi:hypothetical protein